jgi:hypothetical protein
MSLSFPEQEVVMKAYLRQSAAALVLVASIGVANAQTTVTTRETIQLTPAHRTTIYQTVTRQRPAVVVEPGVEVRVGARLPRTVQVYEMPDTIVTEVPTIKRYRYVHVNNQVVLVDPDTSEVVEIIRQ